MKHVKRYRDPWFDAARVARNGVDPAEPNIDPGVVDDLDFGLFRGLFHPLTLLSAAAVFAAVLWVVWETT